MKGLCVGASLGGARGDGPFDGFRFLRSVDILDTFRSFADEAVGDADL